MIWISDLRMENYFTTPDIWMGGFFELALELGNRDDQRLQDAISPLWNHPTLLGCYLDKSRDPSRQSRFEPISQPLDSNLYGIATTPVNRKVACRSFSIRYDNGADWLYFAIPIGSLSTSYSLGAYPFDDGTHPDWIVPVSEWFRKIAVSIFYLVDFKVGLIGFEPDDQDIDSERIVREGIPDKRWIGYLWPWNQELGWYPPNIIGAPMKLERKESKKKAWRRVKL